jgi:hypothetical protein
MLPEQIITGREKEHELSATDRASLTSRRRRPRSSFRKEDVTATYDFACKEQEKKLKSPVEIMIKGL